MKTIRALVTGGAGIIGSHLVDELIRLGHQVVVIDNLSTGRIENLSMVSSAIEIVEADLSNKSDWEGYFGGIDWVFHLAALADVVPSINDPDAYFRSNVDGTFNVLRACQMGKNPRVVYAASSSCYGIPDLYPTPETAEIRPQYPYALTKNLGEQLVLHWAQVYKLPTVSLRFFNVYGPRSRTSGTYGAVFGVFLAQKLAGAPFTIVGDGQQTRDFTYVTDIVDALLSAAQVSRLGSVYNIGSGATTSVNKIVELLGGDKVYIPKRPGEPDCTFADTTRIRRELNWQAKVPIEEGIKVLLEQIDYWQDAPVWTPEKIHDATQDWFRYLADDSV